MCARETLSDKDFVCACTCTCKQREGEDAKGYKPTNMSGKEEAGRENKARNKQVGRSSDKTEVFFRLARFLENNTVFTTVLYKECFSISAGFAMNMKHYQGGGKIWGLESGISA